MKNETVFLTGATGTVGSGVLEVLTSAGFEVQCLVRRPEAARAINQAGGKTVSGDMTDPEVFRRLSATHDFTSIVHTAQAHYRNHSTEEIHRQERIAVDNLEILRSASTRLMVFTAGVWIYGHCANETFIDESTPYDPRPAAAGRVMLMADLAARPDSRWAQLCLPSFVYGSVGPLIEIAQRYRDGDIELCDYESQYWSVIERLDLGRAYLALLRHGNPGDYYVVAEDQPVSILTVHEEIAKQVAHGRTICQTRVSPPESSKVEALLLQKAKHRISSERFKQHTGWQARESFLTLFTRFLPQ